MAGYVSMPGCRVKAAPGSFYFEGKGMKTDSGKVGLQWLSSIVVLVVLGLAVGCGGGAKTADPTGELDEEQKAVDNLVGKISDISGSLPALREIFTKEAAPARL